MKAIILNISAWIMLPFMDAIAKFLSTELPFFSNYLGKIFFYCISGTSFNAFVF